MNSRVLTVIENRELPALLWQVLGSTALVITLLVHSARAETPAAPALNAAMKLDLRLQSRARSYPATFTQRQNLNSRDYLRDLALPTMGGTGRGVRDQSPTEQLARQVHKEGLPLARLWQNEQALVSLGLNRKGKPGLWVIQKTR